MTAAPQPYKLERGPKRSTHLICYALFWLPALAVFLFWLPKFEPIFRKFDEKGDLPFLTSYLLTMSDYDRQSYHVLSLLILVELIALD